jgi:hypothetical protein
MEENNNRRFTRVEFDENGQLNIIYPIEVVTGQLHILNPDNAKTLILIGPTESGKTRFASLLAKDKKVVWLDGRKHSAKNPFRWGGLNPETELLIIDDVPVKKLYNLLVSIFDQRIKVNPRGKDPFDMIRPKTIITCEGDDFPLEPLGSGFTRRFTLMKFPEESPLLWQTARAYATQIMDHRPAFDNDRGIRYLIQEAFESGASWLHNSKPLEVSPVKPIAIEISVDTQP